MRTIITNETKFLKFAIKKIINGTINGVKIFTYPLLKIK